MSEFSWKEEFLEVIDKHKLKKEHLCLVGGVCFSIHGVRSNTDVDISLRKDVLKEALYNNNKIKSLKVVRNIIEISDHCDIHIGRFENIGISDDELIENPKFHRMVDGFKVSRLEVELVDKVSFKSEIDRVSFKYRHRRDDVMLIKNGYKNILEWDWDLVIDLLMKRQEHLRKADSSHQGDISEGRSRSLFYEPKKLLLRILKGRP